MPKLNQSHKNILSVLKSENRKLSVGAISQKTAIKDENVRLMLEELVEKNLVEVERAGRGKITRANILHEGAIAWSASVIQVDRPSNVQTDLAELKMAIDELQKAFEALESGKSKITMSPEKLDAITNLFQKGFSALTYIQQHFHF